MIATEGHKDQVSHVCAGLLTLARFLPILIDAESPQQFADRLDEELSRSTVDLEIVGRDSFGGKLDATLTYKDLRSFLVASCRRALEILEGQ